MEICIKTCLNGHFVPVCAWQPYVQKSTGLSSRALMGICIEFSLSDFI